jgi:hypothetical protein
MPNSKLLLSIDGNFAWTFCISYRNGCRRSLGSRSRELWHHISGAYTSSIEMDLDHPLGSTWSLWETDNPLQDPGLLGPVTLRSTVIVPP